MTTSDHTSNSTLARAVDPHDDAGELAALIARIRSGDEASSTEFVRRYGGRMLAVARRLMRAEDDAADAVQDAFVSAFRSLGRFEGQSRIETWLHRIVVNSCLMKLRSRRSRNEVSIESLLPAFDDSGHHARPIAAWRSPPPDEIESSELRARVRACIDQLPESYRTVLILRDIEQLDTDETAERLGIKQVNAKVRLHRARQALRSLLSPHLSIASPSKQKPHPSGPVTEHSTRGTKAGIRIDRYGD